MEKYMNAQTAIAPAATKKKSSSWKYLAPRKSSLKQQLCVMGTRLPASVVWNSMLVNHESVEDAARNWDIPIEAVEEIVKYCEENEALLDAEDQEERRRAQATGHR